jgi:hypothetical protein
MASQGCNLVFFSYYIDRKSHNCSSFKKEVMLVFSFYFQLALCDKHQEVALELSILLATAAQCLLVRTVANLQGLISLGLCVWLPAAEQPWAEAVGG